MNTKNLRRAQRTALEERIAVGWDDSNGNPKFVFARCLNVSTDGLSLRLDEPIQVRAYVSLRSEKLKISGSASVKYCIRRNSWYQIGLEFSPGTKSNRAPAHP
jgi:hypothetical protein